jgi:hypothetical protein
MRKLSAFLIAGAAVGGLAGPAAAQYQGYPQQSYPQHGYPEQYQGYGYQSYGNNSVGAIVDQLLGNRYSVTDRQAVSRCASAAMAQASGQYGYGYDQGYGRGYGRALRVTAITDVQRRYNGLRVSGLMSSGYRHESYGGQYGDRDRGYRSGEVSFRCNVDYRGAVTNVRIGRRDSDYRH